MKASVHEYKKHIPMLLKMGDNLQHLPHVLPFREGILIYKCYGVKGITKAPTILPSEVHYIEIRNDE